ncbi:AAA family ATPase [Trichocoleus desertorum AS-A10]|uniref:AAA family ATPase n=1 Tax=Trichocoleus desertorum TaxID=1481672 RepID=UPI003297517F
MQLQEFTVKNFRSINDSGPIGVSQVTALLGRNESGKSNLLLALKSLNPAQGFEELKPIKDFPRDRRLEECNGETEVVSTLWKLTEKEKRELTEILPRAKDVTMVRIGRYYEKQRWVVLEGLEPLTFDRNTIQGGIRKIVPAVKASAAQLEEPHKSQLEEATTQFEKNISFTTDQITWSKKAISALEGLRIALVTAKVELSENQDKHIISLEELADSISGDKEAQQEAREWVVSRMPKFIYLDEYPELNGHQNIADYLSKKGNSSLTPADQNFEKLCKVAGLQPSDLQDLFRRNEHEKRNQLANRASALVTKEIKRLWKDRPLKVRFNLDADHLSTFISDPNATFDVEVNLNERSRGFKWFFSFYITFSADTDGGEAANAILLLDEPGLYLHAKSQSDLLRHLETDFQNQVIYTTHSPFMVSTHKLDSVRTVNITEETGTTVSNDPTGDTHTLFPLQAALGYDLAQSLFIGPNNLVVEGVTDYWIISAISEYLGDLGRISLHKGLTLTPAGGAQKVTYMVALLTSERLNVLVLLDEEKDVKNTKNELVKAKLIREKNVIFVSEAFNPTPPNEADIEDLLDPAVYESLVRESYAKELQGKTLKLNGNIPRIAKRTEAALQDLGITFYKTRPTRLLLNKMVSEPDTIVTDDTLQRFETIFNAINRQLESHITRDDEPFY